MDDNSVVLALVLAALLAALALQHTLRASPLSPLPTAKSLPGPPSLPLIGSLPWIPRRGSNTPQRLADLAATYGGFFAVDVGLTRILFLASDEAVQEVFTKLGPRALGRDTAGLGVSADAHLEEYYPTVQAATSPYVTNLRKAAGQVVRESGDAATSFTIGQCLEAIDSTRVAQVVDAFDLARNFGVTLSACLGLGLYTSPARLLSTPELQKAGAVAERVIGLVVANSGSGDILRSLSPLAAFEKLRAWQSRRRARQIYADMRNVWVDLDAAMSREVQRHGGLEAWPTSVFKKVQQEPAYQAGTGHYLAHAITAFFASWVGLEIAVTSALACLAYDQDVQARLYAALSAADDPQQEGEGLALAEAIISETVRVFPERPISHRFRVQEEGVSLQGIPIPKSTPVVVLIECANLGMHGAPSSGAWDPLALRQRQRQSQQEATKATPRTTTTTATRAAWTFGFGRRQCPATAYATRAMAQYLCALVKSHRLDFAQPLDRERVGMRQMLNLAYDGQVQLAHPPLLTLTRRVTAADK